MANKLLAAAAITLIAIAAVSSPAFAGDPAWSLSLAVRDYADIPAATLTGAEREAASRQALQTHEQEVQTAIQQERKSVDRQREGFRPLEVEPPRANITAQG